MTTGTATLDSPVDGMAPGPDQPDATLPELPGPGERGDLHIADRVVEKVAARAVEEVDRATGTPRRVLGVSLGAADGDDPARVDARVDGGIVSVSVSMSVRWPAPVRAVAQQVRAQVRERVQTLTGLEVAEVDIDIPTLVSATSRRKRVV